MLEALILSLGTLFLLAVVGVLGMIVHLYQLTLILMVAVAVVVVAICAPLLANQ
jgi:hypothetical protein